MNDELLNLQESPQADYMIAGWKRQWSDGGEISSGLPQYLIDKLGAKKIGEMAEQVAVLCYPFQVPGTHDTFRPAVSFEDGLPTQAMHRNNDFYDAGNGLIIFLGEEPWFRIDLYGKAFLAAITQLGVKQTVAVEGYNGAAPPDLERTINCIYSQAHMKEELEKFGIKFSIYGSERRSGPTIGMALVSQAHYQGENIEMFRMGAMAPMFPFMSRNKDQVGIVKDHRSFYDILVRLKAMFKLDIDLSELKGLGEADSQKLMETLEKIASNDSNAKRIIERARAEHNPASFEETVELDPSLDRTLEDIIRNMQDPPPDV